MNDVVVRRRADGATELRVNGVFVMDDAQTSSERLLATAALDARARRILVGGLGLGFTAAALLTGQVDSVIVAELHPEVVAAVRQGAGAGPGVLDDPRCDVVIGDVRDVVAAQPRGSLDAICLDVDNGPGFLVHPGNAALYQPDFLGCCAQRLRPGGILLIWSMDDSAELRAAMAMHLDDVTTTSVPVLLQERDEAYWLLGGTRPALSFQA